MKEKIAKIIVFSGEKAAYWCVGKSIAIGVCEIRPPKNLLKRKGVKKNEFFM